jgi:tryptophan synthase alpha chain
MPFVYYVSVTGVTGTDALQAASAGARAGALRASLDLPVVVGFGIDSRQKARDTARLADGVVVGTAIVRLIEEGKTPAERRSAVQRLISELRAGVNDAR